MPEPTSDDKYELLRSLLVKARKEARLTQVEVAGKLGRGQGYVSKYESGRTKLDVIEFLKIAEVIDLDPVEVIKLLKRSYVR